MADTQNSLNFAFRDALATLPLVNMTTMDVERGILDQMHRLVWEDKSVELDNFLTLHTNDTTHDPIHQERHIPLIDTKYHGSSAIGLAAQLGRHACVQVLLKHQADCLKSSLAGYYPLQEAVSYGDRDLIRSIILRRHEQLSQLWISRQPFLHEALRRDLPNFYLEMDWHFKSWIPFVSRFCPSDVTRIWKHGNCLRVDSTLQGLNIETASWVRGNISFLFKALPKDSCMIVLDHDNKLYEEIQQMRDFTEDEIEKDINLRLNTQIYSGKVTKLQDEEGEDETDGSSLFKRKQSFFGLGGDKEEEIGPYFTRVYKVPDIEIMAKYRREHLVARTNIANGIDEDVSNELSNSDGSLDSDDVLQGMDDDEPENMLQNATKDLYSHVHSLPPPKNVPSVTASEYFKPSPSVNSEYMHAGRPILETQKSKKFTATVWMADNFPLTLHQLLPFLEIMTIGNKNFQRLKDFVSMQLPPGFPVRVEIPLFAFLAAQITFANFKEWRGDGDVPRPTFAPSDKQVKPEIDWFEIPQGYTEGVVLKNAFKDGDTS